MCTQTSLILHYEGATKNDPLGRKLEPFQDEKRIVVRTCFNLFQHLFAKGKMCTGFVLCCGNNSDHKCLWLPIMPNHNLVPAKLFSSRCSLFIHAFVVANTLKKTLITQMCSLIFVQIELDPTTMHSPVFQTSKLVTLSHKFTHAYARFISRKCLATIIGLR